MIEIPKSVTFKQARKLLEDSGWRLDRRNGSHCIFVHPDGRRFLVDYKLGSQHYDYRGQRNFVSHLRRALRGEDTFRARI